MPPSTAAMMSARLTSSGLRASTCPPAMPRMLLTMPPLCSSRMIFWTNFSEMPVQTASSEADAGISSACSERHNKRCSAWQLIVEIRIFIPSQEDAIITAKVDISNLDCFTHVFPNVSAGIRQAVRHHREKQDALPRTGRPCEEFRKSFLKEMWYKVRIKMLGLG